jgi:O-antigen ligase
VRSTVLRIQEAFGIGERSALLVAAAALATVGVSVALSTQTNLLVQFVGLLIALLALLISLRWPLFPLFVLAMLIPIEEAIVVGGLGTLSRLAELLFIVAYGLPRLGRLKISAMPRAGWAYVGWAALSVGWAIDPNVTLEELPTLGLLFTTAILVASVVAERPTIVRPVLWVYTISAAVTAVIGISEYAHGGLSTTVRVAALPGQDPAQYAALLLPALVFSAYELLHGRLMALASAVATVCAMGVILSGTRGAWLSAAVVATFYLVPRLTPARRIVAVVLMVGVVALALQLPGVAAFVAERADTALSSGGAGRTDIWSVGLLIYGSAPVTGVGLANFPVAFTPARMREADVLIAPPWRPANRPAHDIVIGTLGELGTVGLIFLVLFLAPLLVRTGWGPDAAAVQAMLASLATMALFLDLLNRKQVWLVLGIACGLAYLARSSPTFAMDERPRTAWSRLGGHAVSRGVGRTGRAAAGAWSESASLTVNGGTASETGSAVSRSEPDRSGRSHR